MKVAQDRCVGCRQCVPYCPVEAITVNTKASIDQAVCVECHICARANVCPTKALQIEELEWPRSLRAAFSDVLNPHRSTGVLGRGTEEMKTNDVTGRLKPGRAGISIEVGRPGLGASLRDVEKIAVAVAAYGVNFEEENPVTSIMADKTTGRFLPEALNERVLSAIIEFDVAREDLAPILATIKQVAGQIDTVFSLCVATVADDYGQIPIDTALKQVGIERRPNGKTNVGLGRPSKEVSHDSFTA